MLSAAAIPRLSSRLIDTTTGNGSKRRMSVSWDCDPLSTTTIRLTCREVSTSVRTSASTSGSCVTTTAATDGLPRSSLFQIRRRHACSQSRLLRKPSSTGRSERRGVDATAGHAHTRCSGCHQLLFSCASPTPSHVTVQGPGSPELRDTAAGRPGGTVGTATTALARESYRPDIAHEVVTGLT